MSLSSSFKSDPMRRWDPHTPQRGASPVPYRKVHRSVFPPGSVEATMPRLGKMLKKSGKDVGVVEAWRVVMALKSGLLVESTWALNALTVFLYDQQTVAQMKLAQLPGLLDALVEHYRRCLCELFFLPGETEALGVAGHTLTSDIGKEIPPCAELEPDYTFTSKPKNRGRKRKNCVLLSKHCSRFSSIPVKVEPRTDPFVIDRTDSWETSHEVDLQDDLSHIVLNISRVAHPTSSQKKSPDVDQSLVVVEATLEDVLSIPCSVLFPDEYDIHGGSTMDEDTNEVPKPAADEDQDKSEEAPKPAEEKTKEQTTSLDDDVSKSDVTDVDVSKSDVTDVDVAKKVEEKVNAETKSCDDVSDKLNDVTNKSGDITVKFDVIKKHNNVTVEEGGEEIKIKEENEKDGYPMCNGIQSDESSSDAKSSNDAGMEVDPAPVVEDAAGIKQEVEEVKNPESDKEKPDDVILPPPSSRVTYRVEKVLDERNVILLEDEALASDGSMSEIFSGSVVPSKTCNKLEELSNRLQCISNIIRGLSFVPTNSRNICQHRSLMRAVSGSLLLRHKHRTRPRHVPTNEEESSKDEGTVFKDHREQTDVGGRIPSTKYFLKSSDFAAKKTRTSELFAPDTGKSDFSETSKKRPLFSATVFDEDDEDCRKAYSDPWWWDCVHRIREDSLVILSNVAHALDLSKLPDDHTALAVIEACLHWSVCPSSDANDTFYGKLRPQYISPQRLSLEILTKLTIKEHNIDLILATRPFSRIEKLFNFLVGLLCDRKEQTMREFAVVLLCNLSSGDVTAARAIALQKGSLSGLISFLEESEEYGINHRRMLPSAPIDCHTTPFMMLKCAKTLLALAQVHENKPGFVKFQLRLLSLSMSQFLAPNVTSTITSVLFEVSHCAT
uniref:AT-rich interactive domain-containing protein 1A-like n=1 Tax=Phallusia mammillata TaxID=59560 RepID=A0A6F9D794_9ASCI|nr:AT-rich interactive domain-containing protein 1A-like [Phallusia mammillata]